MDGVAYVFLNRKGANGLGHVGCAFLLENGMLRCTATENQAGNLYSAAQYKGFWTEDCFNQLEDVINTFQKERTISIPPDAKDKNGFPMNPGAGQDWSNAPYTEWKRLDVSNVDPVQATAMMIKRSREGYSITDRNCENDVYDILHDEGSGYGITANSFASSIYVGWVQSAFGPNAWFDGHIGASAYGSL
jgi:hypothetical protein